MRDYNFFSDYIFTQSHFSFKKLILPIVFSFFLASVIGSYIGLEFMIRDKMNQIEVQEDIMKTPENRSVQQELQAILDEILVLDVMLEETALFDQMIEEEFNVTEELTNDIVGAVPQNIAFSGYTISGGDVLISGSATSYSDVAEFQNNIRDLNKYYNIFVSTITFEEALQVYDFNLVIELRGIAND